MGQPREPGQRPRITRTHLAFVFAGMVAVTGIISLFSSDASAKRQDTEVALIKINPQPLSRVHGALPLPAALQPVTAQPLSRSKPVPDSISNPSLIQTQIKIRPGHSLSTIFRLKHLSHQDLYRIMQKNKQSRALRYLQPGHQLVIESDTLGQVHALRYEIDKLQTLKVSRIDNDFIIETVKKPVEKRVNYAQGQIKSSLFEAGKQAGLSDVLVMEMAAIFGWDIDFALDIREGDTFSVLYEEQYVAGKKYQNGTILAAEFTTRGKTFKAIRFTDSSGHSNYYTPKGLSMRKAFLRTPVDFRRISSRFGRRHHPVLNRMKMHKGVDYAARRGTPIHASGDGKVVFKGRKGGYGRVVILQHGSRYQTLYAHMNGFKRGLRVGRYVKQGQTIGYVGSSGRATGPHLHYEFRVNGVHRNPLTVRLPNAAPINKRYKKDFLAYAGRMLSQLETHKTVQIALHTQ